MTPLTFIRYFVPDSNEFAPGWYQTRNEGRTRIGDVPLSLSDALYDGPNRVIIDDNTPETNSLPVSGGKGVDEFLITRTANSAVIDDDSGANVIVFERDVVIASIERQAGSEGASVAQYVITLSSGKTITLRNPASFTFQHLGDATRTAPISAEDFFTAYEDGFAASDASHPDIIGDASGPSGVQGPMITGTATGAVYEGDPSTSGDLDVNDDTLLASTTPFTISTQGTYGTASIDDDGEWVYKLDNGNTDVRALNSGDTLTDTFVVDVNLASGRATTQTITITISGRTDVFGSNGPNVPVGDAGTSDNQAIFGFNSDDTLTGGSGDDLLVGGYGFDRIDLTAGGTDTVVYRINSSDTDGFVKAEDGLDRVFGFTPGEDKLVILDVNGSPTTLATLFDSLTKDAFQLRLLGDEDLSGDLSSSELDDGARVALFINFQANGTSDGGPTSNDAGGHLRIDFDRVTSEALNDRAVWDTLTGGTNFSERTISTVAQLSSLFGGFGRPGYDAALDDGGFISIIGPDGLPDSYFAPVLNVDTSGSDIVGAVYEGDPSTSGDLDVNDDTLLASTTPFTISTQGTYGTASIGDDGEWVYKLDNGNADVRALNSGDTLTDTFVVDVNPASGRAKTQTVTITISGRTDVFGTNGNGGDFFGDFGTSDNQAIFGFNSFDILIGGSGDDLLVGGYGIDIIDLAFGGADTVVYRINSSDGGGLVKAEDGLDVVREFTPGEDKLVILDVNGSPTTLAGLFDSLTKDAFLLFRYGDDALYAGFRAFIRIVFQVDGTRDGGSGGNAENWLTISFDRVTSEALNDMAVWDTLTGGTNFSSDTISTVAQLSSLFGGFGRPGYDAALDDGGFISIIGPDDLPDSYFAIISGDETGSVTEGGAPGDDNTGTLTAPGHTITLVSKETTDSPGTSTGTYGVMRFNVSSGEWVYTLDDRAEALADQQTATETFIFSAGDATFEVTITITGANDAPVVESGNEIVQQAGRVGQEIEAIDLSGLFTDVDTDDTFTLTVMVLSSDGSTKSGLDTLGLGYDSGTKMITGTLLNSVAAGPYTIEVIATDGSGGESQPSTFDIVVVHPPVIGNDSPTEIGEDAGSPITGRLTITDQDSSAPFRPIALTDDSDGTDDGIVNGGEYGTLTFDSNTGAWSYMVDERAQALNDDTPGTDRFVFTSEGATDFEVTITITGANDAPVVESGNEIGEQAGRVGQEIKAIDLSGLFTDVDTGDTFTLTVMVLSSDGSTKSGLDTLGLEYDSGTKMITGTLLNSVAAGPYTIEVIATDGSGDESQPSTFDIVVAPDNAPVIGGAVDGSIAEDAANPIMGTLTITDADNDALPTVVLTDGAGQYGTLTFVASADGGVWTYTLNSANADVQALGDGETLTETFTFTANGAEDHVLTITINGVNDAPEVGLAIVNQTGQTNHAITSIDLSGLFTDADARDTLTLTFEVTLANAAPEEGPGDLTAIGLTYSERTDPDGNLIREITGEPTVVGTHTIKVIASDGIESVTSSFTIEVEADNAPVISGAPGVIDENAEDPTVTGTLTIEDEDGDVVPAIVPPSTLSGDYGTLTFTPTATGGTWSYALNNTQVEVQMLKDGETLTETFIFTAEGAENYELTITINGANDPIEAGPGIEKQDGQIAHEITINLSTLFTDADGDELTLTFAVQLADGRTGDLAAVGLSYSETTDSVTNVVTRLITGEPTVLGVHTIVVTATAGSESINASFTLEVAADNAAVISGIAGVIDEDAGAPATGMLTIEDEDGDAVPAIVPPRDLSGAYGTLSFTPTATGGTWSYTLDNTHVDVQGLGDGETLTETFVFTAEGAENYDLIITISGVNDAPIFDIVVAPDNAPVIGGAMDGMIAEDAAAPLTGTLTITDADGDALPTVALTNGAGQYGTLTFAASAEGGVWTYTLDNANAAVQALKGDTLTDDFTFTAEGADPITVTITISGVNDVPVVESGNEIVEQAGRVGQEITAIDLSGLFTDVDTDDTFTLTMMVQDGSARVGLDTLGLTYDPSANEITGTIRSDVSAGTYTIEVIATDGSGAESQPSTFNIVIAPDNAPVIGGAMDGSIVEDAADPITGTLTITDAENDALPTVELSSGAGQYGTLTFVASAEGGVWTYTLDNANADVQALKDDTLTDEFTFTAEGANPITVTITITGANDAPTVSGEFINRVGAAGGQFILTNLSDQFTDVDQGDELTFEVTLDDDRPLSTIGLTYNSDEDEITGTLTRTGTYVIKIVATDKSGAKVETTFDLSIVPAIPEIQRSSLTYNPDETSITIDETMLEVTSGNESNPALLVYTITTLPDAGMLLKSGTQLNNSDTFTQADINNGLITYVPNVSDPSTSQSNPLSFTFSDGVETLEEQTLQITSREVFVDETPAEDNTIDRSEQTTPQKIEAGDGSDTITGGQKDDQIDGGAGDDEIKLTRTVGDVEEDAGADEVLYTFGYDGVGIDGGDEIVGFKRGQDKLTFVVDRNFDSLTEFLQSLNGADDEDLTDDDAFIVTMVWGLDTDGAFYFDGVLLHFKEGTSFGGGRIFSPVVQITFDERLGLDDLIEILGGAENVANNFDGGLTAFKNLDEVLPRLFGEGSIGFKGVAPSGTSGASERASEEPLEPPIYETLSEQHGDDLQPTSFELGGGETDII